MWKAPMQMALRQAWGFVRSHWGHLVVALPAVLAFTAVHELAHCLAVWVQGGRVTEFVWLPSGSEWGHMRFQFDPGVNHSSAAIAMAPYALWLGCGLVAGGLALRKTPWPFRTASIVYVWLFVAPTADIANTAVPYLMRGALNDFRDAMGPPRSTLWFAGILVALLATTYGFWLNRRLYRNGALDLPAYLALLAVGGGLIGLVSCGG